MILILSRRVVKKRALIEKAKKFPPGWDFSDF